MLTWLKLIRIKNLLLISISQILIVFCLYNQISFILLLYISSTFLIAAAGNIINDYFDIETDLVNKPKETYIGLSISKKKAIYTYVILNTIGILIALYISSNINNLYFLCYIIIIVYLLYYYSKKIKATTLWGNLLNAGCTSASILLLLILIPSNIYQKKVLLIYSIFSFLLNFTREIIKDIEDIKGDKAINLKTLPIVLGTKRAVLLCKTIMVFTFTLLIGTLYISSLFYLKLFIVIALIAPLIYCYKLLKLPYKKYTFSKISNILKLIIAFGVLSIILI